MTWAAAIPGAVGRLARLGDVLGPEFGANAVEVRGGREGLMVEGFAALPADSSRFDQAEPCAFDYRQAGPDFSLSRAHGNRHAGEGAAICKHGKFDGRSRNFRRPFAAGIRAFVE